MAFGSSHMFLPTYQTPALSLTTTDFSLQQKIQPLQLKRIRSADQKQKRPPFKVFHTSSGIPYLLKPLFLVPYGMLQVSSALQKFDTFLGLLNLQTC